MKVLTTRGYDEVPVRFASGGESLFGIMTAPKGPARRVGVILLNGGACTPSTSRNRLSVYLARRLAAAGFHVLRFDYHGVGESTGRVVRYSLNRPFTADVVAAVRAARRYGVREVVLVGRCFGARTALSALAQISDVKGVGLISMPVHDFTSAPAEGEAFALPEFGWETFRGLFDPKLRRRSVRVIYYRISRTLESTLREGRGTGPLWVSRPVMRWLQEATRRRIPLLFMYGVNELHGREFQEAMAAGALESILADDSVRVATFDGPVHDLTTLAIQEAITDQLVDWIVSIAGEATLYSVRTSTH